MSRRAAYPGSFDPLTIAHLGIAEAARDRHGLDRVDLVISEVALGKEDRACVRLDERVEAIQLAGRERPWLGLVVTDLQLVSDIAEAYAPQNIVTFELESPDGTRSMESAASRACRDPSSWSSWLSRRAAWMTSPLSPALYTTFSTHPSPTRPTKSSGVSLTTRLNGIGLQQLSEIGGSVAEQLQGNALRCRHRADRLVDGTLDAGPASTPSTTAVPGLGRRADATPVRDRILLGAPEMVRRIDTEDVAQVRSRAERALDSVRDTGRTMTPGCLPGCRRSGSGLPTAPTRSVDDALVAGTSWR